jgi:hypothetical protein
MWQSNISLRFLQRNAIKVGVLYVGTSGSFSWLLRCVTPFYRIPFGIFFRSVFVNEEYRTTAGLALFALRQF